ncbi:xanthine dehydrogenase family protein molybdopterin-binding subunit [Amorphus orientalis]|uniref:Carbon-monoxide dehydrogenase large subunit n=1 Tax=Amorphus orientalis TaxID=649198 RepID=A0AAE4AVM9_9HYPH|nr:xanthine dehydrogenase family protein molybdopterin-binding subunit [Amorphus orientalis]MDQ0316829.1 carbon-monoxide dehydrogenase large subunit [Amorphus orientalis]
MDVDRLLVGRGTYVADVSPDDTLYAVFVRSPLAHARLAGVDCKAAREAEGVVAVLTAADLGDVAPIVSPIDLTGEGSFLASIERPILCGETVRHVGDPIAMVIAGSEAAAVDAAELVDVDYDPLPAVASLTSTAELAEPGQIDPLAPDNVGLRWALHGGEGVAAAFERAAAVASLDIDLSRLAPTPIEPRGTIARNDDATGRLVLEIPAQGAGLLAGLLASCLKRDRDSVQVITRDVGGSFGMKAYPYPEYIALAVAAERLRRPVTWIATRAESLQTDTQGRELRAHGELALDADGRFLALRVRHEVDLGGYISFFEPHVATYGLSSVATGLYRIDAAEVQVVGRLTNTPWTDAYRGAGKPEAILVLEALVDEAARLTGIDPIELRRRNLIEASALPFRTVAGEVYDSGDFPARLNAALEAADAAATKETRRRAAQAKGRLFGRGVALWLDTTSAGPVDLARLVLGPDGHLTATVGSQDTGQRHQAAFSAILSEKTTLALDTLLQGNSIDSPQGGGTYGAKTMAVAGSAVANAADALLQAARERAAGHFGVDPDSVVFDAGDLFVPGTNNRISLVALVREQGELVVEARGGGSTTYPNGCHLCDVEIDPETGVVDILGYVAADDYGRIIDRTGIVDQLVGGIEQGLGQALHERVDFDPADAQLLTGSLMDYRLPRAADMGAPTVLLTEAHPCQTTPLGTKGVGQAGAIAASAAILNAVNDALTSAGARPVGPPATPLAVWRSISDSLDR